MRLISFLVAIFWFVSIPVKSANYHFLHITGKDGLPSQQVNALAQDRNGNIWIGTRNGLCRYDGYSVVSYFHDKQRPNSLKHNYVFGLFTDSRGRLWVLTLYGVCRYRPSTDDFKCYAETGQKVASIVESNGRIICSGTRLYSYDEKRDRFTAKRFDPGYIISLAADRRGNVWLSTNRAIYHTTSGLKRFRPIPRSYYSDFITGADGIIPLFVDSKDNLWMGRNGKGLMRIDRVSGRPVVFGKDVLPDGIVRAIAEDRRGRIWAGTEKGIAVINPDGSHETISHTQSENSQLGDNSVYSILCDHNGDVWIGTYFGGVDMLLASHDNFHWYVPGYGSGETVGKVVRMMTRDGHGRLWIATEDGGVGILDTRTGKTVPFTGIRGLGANVHSLYYDRRNDEMWIGTFRNGLFRYNLRTGHIRRYYHERGLESDAIFYITAQKNGTLWVATTLGLRRYDPKTDMFCKTGDWFLDTSFIYTLHVDSKDNVWAGSTVFGLFVMNTKRHRVIHWNVGDCGLDDKYVTCVYQDRRGRVWIGTNNNGMQVMDQQTGIIMTVCPNSALQHSTVCSIVEDRHGHIWTGTGNGLYMYDPEHNELVRYTSEDGLPTNQMNFSSSYVSASGRMYFGTVKGLVSFMPSRMSPRKMNMPVHFKSLVISDREVRPGGADGILAKSVDELAKITLPYDLSRMFSIDYGVIRPSGAANVSYQVKLEGVDRHWRNVGQERRFVGYNLDSGTYTLKVRANGASSVGWNSMPVKSITIVIEPPFYRSTLAYMFYVLVVAVLLYGLSRFAIIRIREKNSLRAARLEKDKIKEIDKAKSDFFTMMSHELKTPLTLISGPLRNMIGKKLDEESHQDLSMAIENVDRMDEMINKLITFNKVESGNFPFYVQKGDAVAAVEKSAGRFVMSASHKHITLTVNCDDTGEDVWFSQSYVDHIMGNLLQNAIKFTPENGHISVRASITRHDNGFKYLHIEVEDNGVGISEDERDNIFLRYYQTKDGNEADNNGWGIGLSLVKRLVEMHKGTVCVDSAEGGGSIFTVDICTSGSAFSDRNKIVTDSFKTGDSVDNETHEPTPELVEVSSPTDFSAHDDSRPTVLVVDDNTDMLRFISRCIGRTYHVVTAENGDDALRIAREGGVGLIISDVMMPGMDGNQLCRAVKSDISTSHIPVILLTARYSRDDIVNGYESGAAAYIAKPFSPYALELQVKNILSSLVAQSKRRAEQFGEVKDEEDTMCELDRNFVDKINQLVEENISNSDFCVQNVTEEMGISRSLLHNKMKSLMDTSMGDYIRSKRLELARKLLSKGYNVSETAYQSGFTDPNHFSKMFKKKFGVSPSEYMRQSNTR